MSCLSSFMRCNEFSVLITFTKDARNDHLAFEDKPARVLFIWSLSLSFLVFIEFVGSLALFCFVVFQHFQSTLRVRQILNVPTNENLMDSNPENEQAMQIGPPRPIHLFAKCRFKNCLATRLKCGGAPSCINRIQSLTSTGTFSNISCKRVLKNSTYFVPVSFPSREKGPIKNLSIIPVHTFKLNWR